MNKPISKRQVKLIKYAATVWGKEGSGILLIAGNKVLLQFRSGDVEHGGVWGIPGGAIKGTDGYYDSKQLQNYRPVSTREAFDSAVIEFEEEGLGTSLNLRSFGWKAKYVNMLDYFKYTTFVIEIPKEIAEQIHFHDSWEVSGWNWFDKESLPGNLHPGVRQLVESSVGQGLDLNLEPDQEAMPDD